jgi:NADPH:quinone reductase-like Zn-dependent oxidoreductase
VVLHGQDGTTLETSLRVRKPGGRLISISGPPDPAFGDDTLVRQANPARRQLDDPATSETPRGRLLVPLHAGERNAADREHTSLIDAGTIRPILDKVFSFASTNEAIAYVESGRAKGKVVVTMR